MGHVGAALPLPAGILVGRADLRSQPGVARRRSLQSWSSRRARPRTPASSTAGPSTSPPPSRQGCPCQRRRASGVWCRAHMSCTRRRGALRAAERGTHTRDANGCTHAQMDVPPQREDAHALAKAGPQLDVLVHPELVLARCCDRRLPHRVRRAGEERSHRCRGRRGQPHLAAQVCWWSLADTCSEQVFARYHCSLRAVLALVFGAWPRRGGTP